MFTKKNLTLLLALVMVASMLLSACGPTPTPEVIEKTVVVTQEVIKTVEVTKEVEVVVTPEPVKVDRKGAWVDTVIFVEEPSADAAVNRLEVGELDVYAYSVSNPEIAAKVEASPNLDAYSSSGSYNELTFNPSGPELANGTLNPFAVPAIREAMNWLIDRNYLAQEIMGGMAMPRWTAFNIASSDYARLADVNRKLELKYAYNKEKAQEVISAEMEKLGATLVDGKWQYNGAPVTLIGLIRVEDERRDIGDYVANQLEDIGFTVTRDYKTGAEASPLWMRGNPADGLWHFYTGGWITTVVPRNLADNFSFFYTNRGLGVPLWQAYVNDPEFYELSERLENSDFKDMDERNQMMARALELSLQDSVRIWLVDEKSITPKRNEVKVAADLYGGVSGSYLWPQTLQREGQVGGSMTIAMPSILTEPWNPIAGTNWIYDMMLIRGTGELAYMYDPFTGLIWPQRLERAEIFVQQGLPVVKTLDWVDLQFVDKIEVPDDAWVDWDAETQRFLTAGEVYTQTQTALRKSVVYYPKGMFETVKWHDGSNLSMGDFIMYMILTFDRAKEASPVYDASAVADFEGFMAAFKGVKILSEDPLIIETYSDSYQLDAEMSISDWWPYYAQGQGAWHTLALGLMADAAGEATFSAAKADELQVEWLSYIAGPTIEIMKTHLDEVVASGEIPYAPTMSEYVDAAEAQARYANLAEWFRQRGHLWVGTGPFYLERAFPVEGTVILKRFLDYPDMADKWLRFSEAPIAEVALDGPGRVTIGSPATYDVYVTFNEEPYAVADIDNVKYLVLDAKGEVAYVGAAEAVEDGLWKIELSADVTGKLEAGSNRLEVVVVSKRVALPSTDSLTFVTAQ
ncbi:MAG TPA: ABC transporter substrate-binding protein [Anaerolineae bacterium]|nr:ABC transporter substrate-binding protein [Anaerolineae bacterium]HQM14715.1 ABC transporter substrate-binding protein [Anaerolineae bacterium]